MFFINLYNHQKENLESRINFQRGFGYITVSDEEFFMKCFRIRKMNFVCLLEMKIFASVCLSGCPYFKMVKDQEKKTSILSVV